jgi:hypothetical protein
MGLSKWAVMVTAVTLLAGCTYTGGVNEPAGRKLSWFSYVAGDDIKSRCTPDAPATYRFVYNANWNEQVRVYDLRRSLITGGGARLSTGVFSGYGGNVSYFSLDDVQGPWRGKTASVELSEDQYLQLIRAVEASGFGQPSPAGLRLESWDFYWTVSACAAGQFHFNAWKYPSDRYNAITFDKLLASLDGTGVAPNPLRKLDSAEERYKAERDRYYTFQLMVGQNGLANRFTPF